MVKNIHNFDIDITDGTYSFSKGEKKFIAKRDEEHPNSVTLISYNDKPFDLISISDPDLLTAEMILKNEGFNFCSIEFEGENYSFPIFETIQNFPEIETGVKILFVADIYDGPISGVIEHLEDLYWYEWCQDSIDPKKTERGMGRIFSLRLLPRELKTSIQEWSERYNELDKDLDLIANPHIWPVSEWQKSKLRSLEDIDSEIKEHQKKCIDGKQFPITAWMHEMGQQFSGFQTFTLSEEDSNKFQQWQVDVANALRGEDQSALDKLFLKPSGPQSKWDIYRADIIKNGKPFIVLRDYQGKSLPEDFWMTSCYSIQDLTYVNSGQ